jgi:putative endonuclease
MWYVYIIQSEKFQYLYVGITNDLKKRFQFHNQKKVFSTRRWAPFDIVYYEAHRNKYDAAAREQFLKSGWGKNWIKKTLKNYFESKKLGG